ncbi:MAG: PHP domain-containing protein [Clostridia bacterium]|nr:PHP domain-containing protein [Clostridia bacterium]
MYRYETHLHTSITSACSRFTPEEIVEKYVRLGYAGIFVTDHFLNGNTTVPRELDWERRVTQFCEGYRLVKKAAEGALDVFFGLEYSYKGTDFLVYGLDEEWLLAHPEIMEMRVSHFAPFARREGALVIQAHPYREANYIDHIRLFPSVVDGIEVINANMDERTNRLAGILADAYNLATTAGSDIHGKSQTSLGGMEFKEKIKSERDFAERIKRGEGSIFTLTDKGVL